MRVWVRTDRLTGLGLTTADAISAIQSQNVQAAVGRIGAPPISNDQQLQLNIQTKGRLASVAELNEQIVIPHQSRRLGSASGRHRPPGARRGQPRSRPRPNGAPAALMAVYQSPGANALSALGGVKQVMADAARNFPDDLTWKVTDDLRHGDDPLEDAIRGVHPGGARRLPVPGQPAALNLPQMIAVPVSLIGTFIVLNAIGYSVNTRFAARDRAGDRHRDDAIVVVEAVEQVMERHPESLAEATKMAMGKFARIIAITLVLLSVFVPVAFIPGISGELFRQFAVTVAVSMFLSAINALTSWCCVRRRAAAPRGLCGGHWGRCRHRPCARRPTAPSSPGCAHLDHRAGDGRRRDGRRVGSGQDHADWFLPEDDQGAFFVIVQLPDGASVGRTPPTWSSRSRTSRKRRRYGDDRVEPSSTTTRRPTPPS